MERGWCGLYTSLKSFFKSRDLELLCQYNVSFWQSCSKLEWFFNLPAHLNLCNIDQYWNNNIWNCHIAIHLYKLKYKLYHSQGMVAQPWLNFLGPKIQGKTNKSNPYLLFHFTFIFLSLKFCQSYIYKKKWMLKWMLFACTWNMLIFFSCACRLHWCSTFIASFRCWSSSAWVIPIQFLIFFPSSNPFFCRLWKIVVRSK